MSIPRNLSFLAQGASSAGVLSVSYGGTGASSLTSGYVLKGNGTSAASASVIYDDGTNVGIGNTASNVNDQVGSIRPLLVSKSDTATTIAGSTACIVVGNSDTTTSNTSQLSFAALTGVNSTYFTSAAINCVFGARTNGQYPTGQLVFSTSTSLNSAPTEKMRIDSSGNVGIGGAPANGMLELFKTSGEAVLRINNTAGSSWVTFNPSSAAYLHNITNTPMVFTTNGTERVRINANGQFGVGGTPDTLFSVFTTTLATNSQMVHVSRPGTADVFFVYAADSYGPNGAAATVKVGSQSATSRSINATGTINASGADYAEYMTKNGDFTIAKGDVCGIDANGKLTNKFSEAISFVVKSTDPSYVGGDKWGTKDQIGYDRPNDLADDATDEEKAKYAGDMAAFETALEAARQSVDRIAFAGQVPVNVFGAVAGQYIVPVDDNGAIKGEAVSNPTFEQYQSSVGKVIAVEQNGLARIIVKVA